MKTVFDNRQCAHVWAQRSQPYGRSGSMSFDGDVIKSYQTPIAAFVPLARDRKTKDPIYRSALAPAGVVLISSEGYSATTRGKHLPAVRRALRPEVLAFTVPDIGHSGGYARTARIGVASDPQSWKATHKANLAYLVAQYRDGVAKLLRTRESSPWRMDNLAHTLAQAEGYARVFKLRFPTGIDWRADREKIEERWARLANDPKAIAKREAAERNRRERAAREIVEQVERFRRGERTGSFTVEHGALLRIAAGGADVETSLGARVTLEDARNFVRFWDRFKVEGWTRAVGTLNVGAFPLREIKRGGDVQIGCHLIHAAEIERIRPMLQGA